MAQRQKERPREMHGPVAGSGLCLGMVRQGSLAGSYCERSTADKPKKEQDWCADPNCAPQRWLDQCTTPGCVNVFPQRATIRFADGTTSKMDRCRVCTLEATDAPANLWESLSDNLTRRKARTSNREARAAALEKDIKTQGLVRTFIDWVRHDPGRGFASVAGVAAMSTLVSSAAGLGGAEVVFATVGLAAIGGLIGAMLYSQSNPRKGLVVGTGLAAATVAGAFLTPWIPVIAVGSTVAWSASARFRSRVKSHRSARAQARADATTRVARGDTPEAWSSLQKSRLSSGRYDAQHESDHRVWRVAATGEPEVRLAVARRVPLMYEDVVAQLLNDPAPGVRDEMGLRLRQEHAL